MYTTLALGLLFKNKIKRFRKKNYSLFHFFNPLVPSDFNGWLPLKQSLSDTCKGKAFRCSRLHQIRSAELHLYQLCKQQGTATSVASINFPLTVE